MTSSAQAIYQRQSPRFQADSDPIAYAVHIAFVSNGFQLVGLDDQISAPDQLYEGLPGTWNITPGIYTFRYRQNHVVVIVKCILMNETMVIHANRSGSDHIITLKICKDDHLQPQPELNNLSAVYSNLDDLVTLISDRIVQELQPAANKPRSQAGVNTSYDEYEDEHYPLRLPQRPIRPHGDFDGDLGPRPFDPFRPESGGSYMGPDHPMFARGRGRGRGRVPRFDPFGPDRGFSGDPNRDIFMPPGFGGPGHSPF